jgi:hypothetical protein
MRRVILLVSILAVVLLVATVKAGDEFGVPFWLEKIVNKLDEIKTAIEGIEVNPIVNVEVKPNITIPEKECKWENRTEEHLFPNAWCCNGDEIECGFLGRQYTFTSFSGGYVIPKDVGYREIRNIQAQIYKSGNAQLSWSANEGFNSVTLNCPTYEPETWGIVDKVVVKYELLPANC